MPMILGANRPSSLDLGVCEPTALANSRQLGLFANSRYVRAKYTSSVGGSALRSGLLYRGPRIRLLQREL